ncbi:MAG: T9SS type A sorting domain-containing protein [Bacteroidales bacterium]|nr:T9SS type A sorting domain-containing protein [Bacteroidales bacterium]
MKKLTIIIPALIFTLSINAQVNYYNNTITGSNASALGEENTSSGTNSFVSGYNSEVSGNYSSSLGYGNTVTAHGAFVMGTLSTATSAGATAIGNKVDATGSYNFVIGKGQSGYHLINNISSSFMVGFESDIPTFFVGSSSGHGTFGKVGIGTTEPIATLDVNGDLNFTGNLLQDGQPFVNSKWEETGDNIYYDFGNVGIGTNAPETKLHISEGDIYLEDINSGIIMKSPDGQCWKGKVDNSGQLNFENIDCNTLLKVAVPEKEINPIIKPNPASDYIEIYYKNYSDISNLWISDISGKLIFEYHDFNSEKINLNLGNIKSGTYIVSILFKKNKVFSETIIFQ